MRYHYSARSQVVTDGPSVRPRYDSDFRISWCTNAPFQLGVVAGEECQHSGGGEAGGEDAEARGEAVGVVLEPAHDVGAGEAAEVADGVDHGDAARGGGAAHHAG